MVTQAVPVVYLPSLTSEVDRQVFHSISQERMIRLDKLSGLTQIALAHVVESVDKLKAASLVNVSDAPVPDLQTVYITAKGLEIVRKGSL